MVMKPIRLDKARVALLTPTYERRTFLPWTARSFKLQSRRITKHVTWYILDDSRVSNEDVIREAIGDDTLWAKHVRYRHIPERIKKLGAKRNAIVQWAFEEGNHIFAAFDDDDWYGPSWSDTVAKALAPSTKIALAGSSKLYLYFPDEQKVAVADPIHPRHSCNGLLCFRREYWEAGHRYNANSSYGEENDFTNGFSQPMIILPDPRPYNLALNHGRNTFDKSQLLDRPKQIVRTLADVHIEDIVPPDVAAFYHTLDILPKDLRPGPRLFQSLFKVQNLQPAYQGFVFPTPCTSGTSPTR